MKRLITSSSTMLLGFSAAVGALLAASVVAFASTGSAGQLTAERASVDPTTLLDSFQRPRTERDVLSAEVEARLGSLSATAPSDALAPGDPVVARSRRVTRDDGTTFFLTPTTRKQLCIAVVPGGSAGCTTGIGLAEDGVEFQLMDADGLGQGQPTVVRGIVSTGAAGLKVASASGTHEATLIEGTFSISLSDVPTAAIVAMRDGSVRQVTIPTPPQP
jgi:hypothetical protein